MQESLFARLLNPFFDSIGQTETNRRVHVTSGFTQIPDINLARCRGYLMMARDEAVPPSLRHHQPAKAYQRQRACFRFRGITEPPALAYPWGLGCFGRAQK